MKYEDVKMAVWYRFGLILNNGTFESKDISNAI